MSSTTEEKLRLRAVATTEDCFSDVSDPAEAPIAEAKGAVPLVWLALFEYDEVDVRRFHGLDVFGAVAPVEDAVARIKALRAALPASPEALRGSAEILGQAVQKAEQPYVALYPLELFRHLRPADGRQYLKQLVNLCDLWERTREGLPWEETQQQLEQVGGHIKQALGGQDQQMVCYTLVGTLAEKWSAGDGSHLVDDSLLVTEGQGPDDVEPEALAVGEQGLILGRFDGVWKLMSSDCSKDLRGVWGEGNTAWAVGRGGTVAQLTAGRWQRLEVPTAENLSTVWAMNPETVCVGGDGGTVLVSSGAEWRPWAVPSQSNLRCLWGTGPDNICLAGEEPVVFRYDGYSWQQLALPGDGTVSAFGVIGGKVIAVGGSPKGGELFVLDRGGWTSDTRLPRTEWLEGLWLGWGDAIGVVLQTGEALTVTEGEWSRERLPLDSVSAVAGGALPMAVGRAGRHSVVVARTDGGWEIEAGLVGLKLSAVWVAGRPKPPRLRMDAKGDEPRDPETPDPTDRSLVPPRVGK